MEVANQIGDVIDHNRVRRKFNVRFKIRKKLILLPVLLVFFLLGFFYFGFKPENVKGEHRSHPFLLVNESKYDTLRALALNQPWANMKIRAITNANLAYDSSTSIVSKSNRMRDIVSGGALAYILDPTNKVVYRDKIIAALNNWDTITSELNCADWNYAVPPGNAFFNSVLSLDVIYNDVTPTELSSIEAKLQRMADWYWDNPCSWVHTTYAVRGVWALYQGDRVKIDSAKTDYKNSLLHYLTPDGVYDEGPGYAWARFGSNEDAKAYFMDVLEFTDEDNAVYSNNQLKNMYEWLYSGSLTPFKQRVTFGDTSPEFYPGTAEFDQPVAYRAYKFSAKAAQNASWLDPNPNPPGRLLSYLFLDGPLSVPQKPVSTIWPSSMASFWENSASNNSLMAALWNPQSSEGHSHKDVNALHVSAYGENILRNSGYAGWGNGCLGSTWAYVHDTAVSNNTVLIDSQDHVAKQGNGIVEGFVGLGLDYAAGDSGSALSNGKQFRNLLFIHPQDGVNGYIGVIDEVNTLSGSGNVSLALHPSSSNYTITSNLTEYNWMINQYSGHPVYANIFLGTTPSTVAIKDGALCTKTSTYSSILGKYLYATYPTSQGKKNIVTAIYPSDDTHPKAQMARITGNKYSGVKVTLSPTVYDTMLESSTSNNVNYQGVSFKGIAAFYRSYSSVPTLYFVKKGTSFNNGQAAKKGFTATNAVTIYLKEKVGNIVSDGSDVTFYYPGIINIALDGDILPKLGSGSGWVKVAIPTGNHSINLVIP